MVRGPTKEVDSGEDRGLVIGGVFCGFQIAPGLYCDEVAFCRYVIRQISPGDPTFAKRKGEVVGSGRRFQALKMNGEHVGVGRSLIEAAGLLAG